MKKSTGGCFGAILALVVIGGCSAVVAGSGDDDSPAPSVTTAVPTGGGETPDRGEPTGGETAGGGATGTPEKVEKAPDVKSYGDGEYQVGVDIPTGTYESEGAQSGFFEFCAITTEGDGGNNWGQIKSANANERIIITLTKSDGVLTISGCEPLKPRG